MVFSPSPSPSPASDAPQPAADGHAIELRIGRTLGTLLTVLAGAAVALLVWQIVALFAHLLLIIVLALLVAFIFAPLASTLERYKLPRVAAIAVAYLGILALSAGVLTLFLGPLIAQLAALAGHLPREIQTLQARAPGIDQFFRAHGLPVRVATVQKQALDQAQAISSVVLGSTLTILGGLTAFIVDLFLILVLSFYFLLDAQSIRNNLVRLLPARLRTHAFFVQAAFTKVVGGYLRGQLLMALTIGVAAGAGCAVLGVPYPLVIGLLAGLFELMPMIGPVLGAVPAVLISLFQGFPLVLWVALLFLGIQQVESNVIGPRITGHAVGLHPLGALLALLAGVELGGLLGALFAVPVAGILYVLAVAVYWQWRGQAVPQTQRGPSRVVGLARGVVRRRASGGASPVTEAAAHGAVPTAAAVVTTLGGSTPPRPETLVSLDREADHLREEFEQAETDRHAEQVESAEQGAQARGSEAAG